MEGDDEEASNVNEPHVLVDDGANQELPGTEPQCDSQPPPEPPPPPHEVVGGTRGDGDAIGGEESSLEESRGDEIERNDGETGISAEEEEAVVEVRGEGEKVGIGVEEESAMAVGGNGAGDAAVEMVVVVSESEDEAVESEVGGEPPSVAVAVAVAEEKVDEKADEAEVANDNGLEELAEEEEVVANVVEVAEDEDEDDAAAAAEEANLAAQVEETEAVANVADETEVAVATEELNSAEQVEDTKMEDATEKEEEQEHEQEQEEEKEGEEMEGNEDRSVAEEELEAAEVMEETTEAEETEAVEEAEGMEVVEEEEEATLGGKRKRRKNVKAPAKVPAKKKMEEDVCFICFDGGELVLCDRRGCPKAYHPSCVDRDEAFFRTKGRWNCGWHQCSNCQKNAYYTCYTCTFSLCKACIKAAVILCVRGNKGFCETCMKTIMLIEKNENNVDFDDRSSFEYLFKDYWMDLKGKLSLTLDELEQAKSPWKGSDTHAHKQESADEPFDPSNDVGSDSDGSTGNLESSNSKRRKTRRRSKSRTKDKDSRSTITITGNEGLSVHDSNQWASKELLEFVMHMKNGDASALTQFDVQALLLEYIKRNKLRDPRRKSQIICDTRLENLFGKPRVGHFEMLKLLESHFLIKEDSHADDLQGSTVDPEASQLEADGNSDAPGRAGKDKKRKTRRKSDGRGPQSNLEDYAAINMHNINLIYLRRNLVEDLIDDTENFHEKVVGAFVRIRILGSAQKQDLYRLVQVIGTSKGTEPYKVGKRTTDILLEILNLNKTETVAIDIISNQEFTEDECKRLRQSIKCGFINRLTVGDVQEKAMALQAVRVKDWLESEVVRLSHLRDRASEKGRRKEECVEKLQLLKTPEERKRRLEEIPEIHADPNMDPNFESEEEEETDDKRQENYTRPRGSAFGRRGREPVSPRKGGSTLSDTWSGTRNYSSMSQELSRSMSSRGFSNKVEDTTGVGEIVSESWNLGRDREMQPPNSWEKHKMSTLETGSRSTQPGVMSESFHAAVSENSGGSAEPVAKINESEKIWHYQDPAGKVQGPFSIVQLRKWNATGYFPVDLRIWKATEKQDDSILLADALAGKFQKDKVQVVHNLHQSPSHAGKLQGVALHRATEVQVGGESWRSQSEPNSLMGKVAPTPVDVPKYSSDGWGSTNLPSPTPSQTPLGTTKVQAYENKWSGNPVQSAGSLGINQFPGNTGVTQESMTRTPDNSKPEKMMPLGSTNDLPTHHLPTISAPVLNHGSVSTDADIKSVVSNLQGIVQSVASHLPPVETQGWGSASLQKPEMILLTPTPGSESQPWRRAPSQVETNNHGVTHAQPPAHGQWGDVPTINTSTTTFNAGNAGGNFPATGFQTVPPSDPWRPAVPSNQPNIQPPAPPNAPWDVGVVGNQSAAPRMGQENQNPSWGPVAANPNMGWAGPGPGNANMNWGGVPGQGLGHGNSNPGWGTAPGHGPTHGNPVSGWGPPPMNTNANQSWAAHGQGQPPGNANHGWAVPSGNQGNWGSDRSHNTDRFANQREMGSQGGDSGYGSGKPWNRQSSFGSGGSSRPPFKGQRVCKFHESGHCKKGASCDYLHT